MTKCKLRSGILGGAYLPLELSISIWCVLGCAFMLYVAGEYLTLRLLPRIHSARAGGSYLESIFRFANRVTDV